MRVSSTVKKILFVAFVIICLIIIQNLVRSVFDLWSKQDLVIKAKKDLEREKQENQRLKAQLSLVKSQEFIEEEARNELFLVKPGETSVIVPKDLIEKKKKMSVPKLPNWQKWLNLFGL